MNSNILKSEVNFKSNLQPLNKDGEFDEHFYSKVRDPFAIRKLYEKTKGKYRLSDIQEKEYRQVSLHCSYADEDDYPFGTVIEDGHERVVCRCINTDCVNFERCRPDFDKQELDVLKENDNSAVVAEAFDDKKSEHLYREEDYESEKKIEADFSTTILTEHGNHDESNESELINEKDEEPADKQFSMEFIRSLVDKKKSEIREKGFKEFTDTNNYVGIGKYRKNIFSMQHRKDGGRDCFKVYTSLTFNPLNGDTFDKDGNLKSDKYRPNILIVRKPENLEKYLNIVLSGEKEEPDIMDLGPVIVDNSRDVDISFESFVETTQQSVIESEPYKRTIVNAGPGTGKTWTLIEKIKYMLSEQEVDPENILVLCFSRAAVEVIKSRLEKAAKNEELPLNWHLVDVRTFDSFATYLIAWVLDEKAELLPEEFSLESADYDSRIRIATSIIDRFEGIFEDYEHIIVDEVQDLVGVRAGLVLSILKALPEKCGFTLLGDSCQSLYDYLTVKDNHIMSSSDFYNELFSTYKDAEYLSFEHNYRQGDELGNSILPYRKAILSGKKDEMIKAVKELSLDIHESDVNIKHFTEDDAKRYEEQGTVGILTRTNGQALQISEWLRNEDVDHNLQKPSGTQKFAKWISDVLCNTDTDVIDYEEFSSIFAYYYAEDEETIKSYWYALIGTQRDSTQNHYEIGDLVKGLIQNPKDPLLFRNPDDVEYPITVSNIHRAKGKEFDTVLVLEDVISSMEDDSKSDILENKVCYVALTRPRKNIEKIELKNQYISIMKDETRRCFKGAGFQHHKYLSHFEVGIENDVDERSFAASSEIQDFINEELMPGDRIKLIKRDLRNTEKKVIYKIVPEKKESLVLGYTTESFYWNMKKAIQRVFNNYGSIAPKYFPDGFNDIYFDGVTTCVSLNGDRLNGACEIDGAYIWNGIMISGFGHRYKP